MTLGSLTTRIITRSMSSADFDPNFFVLDTTQIYDIATNTWTTGAPMPDTAGRYFPAAVYYPGNDKIYVMGGFDGVTFSEQSQTWEYDPVANTWNTSRAPIPVAMGGAGYSIVGQFAYLAGHWNNGLASTDHYRYDIVADSWTPWRQCLLQSTGLPRLALARKNFWSVEVTQTLVPQPRSKSVLQLR